MVFRPACPGVDTPWTSYLAERPEPGELHGSRPLGADAQSTQVMPLAVRCGAGQAVYQVYGQAFMTKRTPNYQLKDLVAESGLTYAALAKAVRAVAAECGTALRTNKSTIEHWISGVVPAGDTGRCLAVALSRRLGRLLTLHDLGLAPRDEEDDSLGLSLGEDPLDTLLPMWRNELDRRRFLTTSAYSVAAAGLPLSYVREIADRTTAARTGQTIGMAEVAAVRDMVRLFSEMDERHGGQHGRSALVQYLRDDVTPLCRGRFRTEKIRQHMLSAASRGVHLLGWKSYDAGQQGLAQRYYLQSYALAVESGVPGHDGFVMRTMAMQGLKLHRPEHCQALAETGLGRAEGKVDVQTEALFRVVHAHTLAKSGQRRAAIVEAERARSLLAADRGDEVPFWALTWGPPAATVYSRNAKVYETLGDRKTAAEQYARAAASRPAGYARIVALDLVASAEMQLKGGSIEQACATWNRAMDHMDGVRSVRTRKAVTRMRRDLTRFRARGLRCAADLDERAIEFLRPG
ncbi:Tat pathway signal protein [Streptomyces cuspidosporus]|uniref:Tat pathway signal protein n=2 Tax=Streptomyces cuspidosporus TaxID=66882 RepID=A0ABN3GF64_9ACTN